jgi:hypothetical protein
MRLGWSQLIASINSKTPANLARVSRNSMTNSKILRINSLAEKIASHTELESLVIILVSYRRTASSLALNYGLAEPYAVANALHSH